MQRPGRKKPLKQSESVPETEEVTRGGGGPAWLSGQVDSISVALNVRGTITKSSQVEPHWRAHTHTDARTHSQRRQGGMGAEAECSWCHCYQWRNNWIIKVDGGAGASMHVQLDAHDQEVSMRPAQFNGTGSGS